jgi:hypothetical protein
MINYKLVYIFYFKIYHVKNIKISSAAVSQIENFKLNFWIDYGQSL